jgi:hypothetical protein
MCHSAALSALMRFGSEPQAVLRASHFVGLLRGAPSCEFCISSIRIATTCHSSSRMNARSTHAFVISLALLVHPQSPHIAVMHLLELLVRSLSPHIAQIARNARIATPFAQHSSQSLSGSEVRMRFIKFELNFDCFATSRSARLPFACRTPWDEDPRLRPSLGLSSPSLQPLAPLPEQSRLS